MQESNVTYKPNLKEVFGNVAVVLVSVISIRLIYGDHWHRVRYLSIASWTLVVSYLIPFIAIFSSPSPDNSSEEPTYCSCATFVFGILPMIVLGPDIDVMKSDAEFLARSEHYATYCIATICAVRSFFVMHTLILRKQLWINESKGTLNLPK